MTRKSTAAYLKYDLTFLIESSVKSERENTHLSAALNQPVGSNQPAKVFFNQVEDILARNDLTFFGRFQRGRFLGLVTIECTHVAGNTAAYCYYRFYRNFVSYLTTNIRKAWGIPGW
jgi:hypothetical protein